MIGKLTITEPAIEMGSSFTVAWGSAVQLVARNSYVGKEDTALS